MIGAAGFSGAGTTGPYPGWDRPAGREESAERKRGR